MLSLWAFEEFQPHGKPAIKEAQRANRRLVEPEVKDHVERVAKQKNMTVADYIRSLPRAEREKGECHNDDH